MWRLAIRNWWASPGRIVAVILSVALGVSTVVIITSAYETARRTVTDQVIHRWLGAAHLTVYPPGGHWGTLSGALIEPMAGLDHVQHITANLTRRMLLLPFRLEDDLGGIAPLEVDAIGINPITERPFRSPVHLEGRQMRGGERGKALIERDIARLCRLQMGEAIALAREPGKKALRLEIIGMFDGGRLAGFQRPNVLVSLADLQSLTHEPGKVTAIQVMLDDPSPTRIARTETAIRRVIREKEPTAHYEIESAAARQALLNEADRITRLLLILVAFVALLTSFFIIVTTMSMSLFDRRSRLGVMRCVGMTRYQLVRLLFFELIPVGLVGTTIGVLLGVTVMEMASRYYASWGPPIYLSRWGLGLAITSGVATTFLSTALLVVQIARVTPMEAIRVQAHPPRQRYLIGAGFIGATLLGLHEWILRIPDPQRWFDPLFAEAATASLYLGYVLLAPTLVVLLGPLLSRIIGPLLGLRSKLAEDQFGRAPWRSTGVCWVLMVGLSLIIYMAINAQAVLAIWDFPARLPEAFVWSPRYVAGDRIERVKKLPGVTEVTTSTDIDCEIVTHAGGNDTAGNSLIDMFLRKLTRPVFVAGDTDSLLGMLKVAFIEGTREQAAAKLKRGGYVLIPTQTAKHLKLHEGDRVTIRIRDRSAAFEIAGVIQSPALDLAVTAFQATSYMQFAASSAMLGTREDLKEKFGLDVVSMFLCNLELPPVEPPGDLTWRQLTSYDDDRAVAKVVLRSADQLPLEQEVLGPAVPVIRHWLDAQGNDAPPEEVLPILQRFARAMQWVTWRGREKTVDQRWAMFRERLLLLKIANTMDRPGAIMGSLRTLKENLLHDVRQALAAITWLPAILLVVAIVGIANLMMVSVRIRARQIAVLRAVGALKSQIVRLVLAEAIALSLIGSLVGIALGVHEAWSDHRVTEALIGLRAAFIIPYGTVALGVALTTGVCLLAGIAPACRAARNNIIDAMQTT